MYYCYVRLVSGLPNLLLFPTQAHSKITLKFNLKSKGLGFKSRRLLCTNRSFLVKYAFLLRLQSFRFSVKHLSSRHCFSARSAAPSSGKKKRDGQDFAQCKTLAVVSTQEALLCLMSAQLIEILFLQLRVWVVFRWRLSYNFLRHNEIAIDLCYFVLLCRHIPPKSLSTSHLFFETMQ